METILLINNDEDFLERMQTYLMRQGYTVETLIHAEDAKEYAEHHPPDLIVLDPLLQKTNGFELCQAIKRSPVLQTVPIIMTSAIYISDEERTLGFQFERTTYSIEADVCLMKPVEPEELGKAVARALGKEIETPSVPDILIVDDEPQIRELLRRTLEEKNYHILEASTGTACLEYLTSATPDVILLDYRLPDISGIEVLHKIRDTLPHVAVIIMTAYGDENIAMHAIEEHVDGYLRKPFVVKALFSVVEQTLEWNRIERERQRLLAQLRESNRELMAHYERLEQANRDLRAVDQLKSEFLANVGHELRTPLNSIIGFTELLLQGYSGDVNEEQCRQLRVVLNSGNQLLRVLNDVMEVSMLNAGQVELHREDLALNEIINDTLQDLQVHAQKKHLTLSTDIEQLLPLCYCSYDKIRVIVYNLVDNAIKFSSSGTITIAVQMSSDLSQFHIPNMFFQYAGIPEQMTLNAPHFVVSVADQGIGVSEENFEILFDEFRQVDGSLTREYNGTGLGLAISKKLVDMHKGYMWVNSQIGKGSTFYFTLPVNHE